MARLKFPSGYILVLALLPWSMPAVNAAVDEFCGAPDTPSQVSAFIPVIKQGNFADFARTSAMARDRLIFNLGDISARLLSVSEFSAADLQQLYTFFSDFYDYMANAADEGIGQALSARLPAEIERLYRNNPVPFRKIRFVYQDHADVPSVVAGNYLVYGIYSVEAGGRISFTATVVNPDSREQRSFGAIGQPEAAVREVARQIFDSFQLPGSPQFQDPLPGKDWVMLPGASSGRQFNAASAPQLCSSLQGRLPTRGEMEIAYAFGQYYSGIDIQPRSTYVVYDEEGKVALFTPSTNRCVPDEDSREDQGLVVCIRDK